jgi:hypothetical protein
MFIICWTGRIIRPGGIGMSMEISNGNKKINKISVWLSGGFFVLSILLFWLGLGLLKTEVFPHYYNPSRHTIVSQNPDTKEIYQWKDSADNVYNNEDSDVKNFTWGTTVLLLFIMVCGSYGYSLSMNHCKKVMLGSDGKTRENYVPRLQ